VIDQCLHGKLDTNWAKQARAKCQCRFGYNSGGKETIETTELAWHGPAAHTTFNTY